VNIRVAYSDRGRPGAELDNAAGQMLSHGPFNRCAGKAQRSEIGARSFTGRWAGVSLMLALCVALSKVRPALKR
jgi:hypothetical protein